MADNNVFTDAVSAYVASMTPEEFASFTAAVREPSEPREPARSNGQAGRDEAARRFGARQDAGTR
ncbi:hypothetical protein ACWDNI_16080 [Nocardia niigatensis]